MRDNIKLTMPEEDLSKVDLTPDDIAFCKKNLDNLGMVFGLIRDSILKNQLTVDDRRTYSSVLESYVSNITNRIGYDSDIKKEKEGRYKEIANANNTIYRLEKELESKAFNNISIQDIKDYISKFKDLLHDWWKKNGFNYIKDVYLSESSLTVQFGISSHCFSTLFDENPVTSQENKKVYLEKIMKEWDLENNRGDIELLNTDRNINKLKELFASVGGEIRGIDSVAFYKGGLQIREIKVLFKNDILLKEIMNKNIQNEVIEVKENE